MFLWCWWQMILKPTQKSELTITCSTSKYCRCGYFEIRDRRSRKFYSIPKSHEILMFVFKNLKDSKQCCNVTKFDCYHYYRILVVLVRVDDQKNWGQSSLVKSQHGLVSFWGQTCKSFEIRPGCLIALYCSEECDCGRLCHCIWMSTCELETYYFCVIVKFSLTQKKSKFVG